MRLCVLYVRKTEGKGHTYTYPRPSQYLLTHAHIYSTLAVAATYSCFALVRAHQHGIAVGCLPSVMPWEKCRPHPSQQPPYVLCGSGTKSSALHAPRLRGTTKPAYLVGWTTGVIGGPVRAQGRDRNARDIQNPPGRPETETYGEGSQLTVNVFQFWRLTVKSLD